MIKEYIVDGEAYKVIYKESNGLLCDLNVVDEAYCSVSDTAYNKVLDSFLADFDLASTSNQVLYSWITHVKSQCDSDKNSLKGYFACRRLCEQYLKKNDFSVEAVNKLSAIYVSCLRKINSPERAVAFYEYIFMRWGKEIDNSVLLTSVAASYCDQQKYEQAYRTANRAYAKQGGSVGYSNELAMVFKRIKKESGIGIDFD